MYCVKNKCQVITILALAVLLAACGCSDRKTHTSSHAGRGRKVLNVALSASIPNMDPAMINDDISARVSFDLFEGLVAEDQNNKPIPGVAKSWTISSHGLVYTFILRNNAKWSNGMPVTAQDFVFALRRSLTPETAAWASSFLSAIRNATEIMAGKKSPDTLGVKAINNRTLEIELVHPQPYFLSVLTLSVAYPVYSPAIKKYGKSWILPEHIVSNGAYKLRKWIINGLITVIKNPHYWDASHVKIDTIHFYPITSPTIAYNQYLSGRLDMTYKLPQNMTAKAYKKKYGAQFVNVTMLGTYFYWMNIKQPGLNKLNVRKALTMTVDRKAITDHILKMG